MTQDTNIENLIINKLTKAQYESIANPDPAQLYFITDEVISSSDVVNALGYTPENVANKTTTLSSSSTDTQYPSAKAVYDQIANIDTLPSQTGQSGKFLTTDGTDASWGNLPVATASTVGVVKPDNASIRVDNDGTLSAICRNVGEIITSTLPLTDAGLHLLDGTLLPYGIYKEFIDYIADLYTENPTANYFTTEALWQQSVSTYGVCGKFVYDSTNNTVRLPKVTGKLDGTTDVNALGDLEPLFVKMPNITGSFFPSDGVNTRSDGCVYDTISSGYGEGGGTIQSFGNHRYYIDASRSSSVYSGNGSDTAIHEQAIKCFIYIVIATSSKTEIQTDIDEVATDLNGKADTDLTNVTDTGYIKMAGAGMPSNKYIDLTLGASGTKYTAPANGWFAFQKQSNGADQFCQAYVENSFAYEAQVNYSSGKAAFFAPVLKGQDLVIGYNLTGNTDRFQFIYAQGSKN